LKYLLDTCVISELVRPQPNKNVTQWFRLQKERDLYLSVLTFGEIRKGIDKAKDIIHKDKLNLWVEKDLYLRFKGRILPIDLSVANKWGKTQAIAELKGLPMPTIDGLIATTGLVHNCIVVTRNTADMQQSQVELLNPWIN